MTTRPDAPTKAAYHHGDLRRALLDAAQDLVAAKGAEGFSLREAARAVGVSPAAAYRHFEDKAALLGALALEGMARLALAMEKAVARAPGEPGTPAKAAASFAAIGAAYVDFAVKNPSHFRVMFGPWCDHPAPDALPQESTLGGRDPYQLLVDALDELVRTGAIPAAARPGAEIAAWSAVHGLASLLVEEALPHTAAERGRAFAVLRRTLLLGLGCDPSLAGPPPPLLDTDPRRGCAPKQPRGRR